MRPVFSGIIGAVFLAVASAAPVAASDEVFTVGNYPVDAEAKNAVAAKERALADGQQAAFGSLLKRLVPVTEYDRIRRLSEIKSSGFLEGVSVRSERNSRTRYIATLDFAFRADSVRGILQQEGIPFVEEQAREIVLVPIVINADGAIETGAAGKAWTRAWGGLDAERTLAPFQLQGTKPAINAAAVKALTAGSSGDEQRAIADAYGSPYVLLAIAEPDKAAGRLHVSLVGIDAVGGINLRRSYRVFDNDVAYAMELAAVVASGVLEGRWKALKAPAASGSSYAPAYSSAYSGGGSQVVLRAQYSSLGEWSEMRRQLLALPGVEDVRIEAESARGADLTLRYPGGANQLSGALYARGLALENGADRLILRSAY